MSLLVFSYIRVPDKTIYRHFTAFKTKLSKTNTMIVAQNNEKNADQETLDRPIQFVFRESYLAATDEVLAR